jgi:hypothetical protein
MEEDKLYRELNAYTVGLSFNPPTHFSKNPTWVSVHHKSECMKLFLTKYKFVESLRMALWTLLSS